ncbi:hypothetical protein PMI29_04831 [Pseudomonas sp. GM49]|nr:hypothetical protein PMI29_04831 [Pseudomonas sp. GM49]
MGFGATARCERLCQKFDFTDQVIDLNVNQTGHAAKDTKVLADVCTQMVTNLVGEAPADMAKRVGQGKPFEDAFNGYRVFLSKSIWSTGRGYELNFVLAQCR